jgi:transposase InsO family protein
VKGADSPPTRNLEALHVNKDENGLINLPVSVLNARSSEENAPPRKRIGLKRWERRLPPSLTINAASGTHQLKLEVEIKTIDDERTFRLSGLVDSGASGLFIDRAYVERNKIPTRRLQRPIPVLNVDGTPNEGGSITEVVSLVLRYQEHSERALFAVTSLGGQDLILGLPWLKQHNPEVDWKTGEVRMTRCNTRCQTCKLEIKAMSRERKRQRQARRKCREGPMPTLLEEEEEEKGNGQDAEEQWEHGDRIIATALHPVEQTTWVRATTTISQRLAEAAAKQQPEGPKGFKELVPEYLHEFEDVFSKESFDNLPERKRWDHAIELIPQAIARSCKVYPLSREEQGQLDEFLAENLRTGRIRPSKSPMASPVFFIKKKDGSLRLVQDYRALNDLTIKNRYPLPLISELIGQLHDARFFTKLDVRWGYNNIRIKDGDEWKAAFRTNRGLFEPLVMFFGLTNSPATFQTMMDDIFRDLIAKGVVCVYLDDILIYTRTLEEHRQVVKEVLKRLREYKLFLKPEKCEFEKAQIEYLGLIVGQGHAEMDPIKVAGVQEWPTPTNKKEVQAFLGFVNFYRRFIKDFSHHARPLFDLTKKAEGWKWEKEQKGAFERLKEAVTTAPVLAFPDEERPFRLEADSSDFATGAVLSQLSDDEKWHPIGFYSKSLSEVERNYETHDKEMLAIIRALEEWRHLLEGARHKVEVWTDHKNLEYFRTARKLNRRQARWSLLLSRFEYTLHHRPGRTMGKADALSRRADHGDGSMDNDNVTLLSPELFTIRAIEAMEVEGEEREILEAVKDGNRKGQQEDAVAIIARGLSRTKGRTPHAAEWRLEGGVLFHKGRIYVPKDAELRRRIVAQHHDTKVAGHPGRWKTLELVTRNYWWPQINRYIGTYTKTCDLCLRTKASRQLPTGQLHPLEIAPNRWEQVSVDFVVELPDAHGFDAVMSVVDTLSKRVHFIPTHTTVTAEGAARLFLHHVWKLHGLPRKVVSDRGTQFIAGFTKELYRLLGIKIAASTAYHPQTDGQTERANQELEQYLRLFTNERQEDWDDLLPMAEFQHNNRVHASTHETPFMLDTGRHPRMGFEPLSNPSKIESVNEFKERMKSALEEARSALIKAQEQMKTYYDRRRLPTPNFQPGDRVFLDANDIRTTRPSQKLAHRKLGPFEIAEKIGSHAYRLKLPRSMQRLHPVFSVVKLTEAPVDPIIGRKPKPPPPPVLIEGEPEYEVEEILNSRMFRRRFEYLVKWRGYGPEESSWEPRQNIHAPQLVAKFHRDNPGAPRFIRSLTFKEIPFRVTDMSPSHSAPTQRFS